MDFGRFRKNSLRKIHGIKNHAIWISIRKEIKQQNLERKSIAKREKIDKLSKIQLIYDS